MLADCAMDCETNRVQNDNFRLDMTWAEQESRQATFLELLEQSSSFVKMFNGTFLWHDRYLGLL